ncbi:MAG: LacI family transcriptional regulator [Candidatus Aminicenantes bacterium]|nr:LacI family transcriptional regulator [Candidatus Aminicenantes bacterium]
MSIKQIQKLTGFSYSTISRVLNGKAKDFRISDETCRVILDAAEKVEYRPNILARSLRLKKSMTIGLIVPDIQNPFFGELAWRIERLLREHGYSTILCNSDEIPANEEFYLKVLIDRQVDGIIIAPIHTSEWKDLEAIRKETAVVLIDRIFYRTDLPWVTSDNVRAAEALADELIKLGYRRIAYLGGTPDTYINTVRFQGFRAAMEKARLPLDERMILFKGYSPEAGELMMKTVLERARDIEAVFCVNNLVFLGAMKIVQQEEARTNRQILMAAFDILHYCEIFKRPLLCANQDLQKLATSVVSLLVDTISGRPVEENQLVMPVHVDKHRLPQNRG